MAPIHDTPILAMVQRPLVVSPTEYGNPASFWIEYPSGLVDLTRSQHLADDSPPSAVASNQLEISVDGGRILRINDDTSALVIIDMQKWVHVHRAVVDKHTE